MFTALRFETGKLSLSNSLLNVEKANTHKLSHQLSALQENKVRAGYCCPNWAVMPAAASRRQQTQQPPPWMLYFVVLDLHIVPLRGLCSCHSRWLHTCNGIVSHAVRPCAMQGGDGLGRRCAMATTTAITRLQSFSACRPSGSQGSSCQLQTRCQTMLCGRWSRLYVDRDTQWATSDRRVPVAFVSA